MNTIHVDLNKLRVFHEAARRRSYTAAASALCVTQSAVSHAISRLESSTGQRLIVWKSRQMKLTEAGERLLKSCDRIFSEIEELRNDLQNPESGSRNFRLGATVEFGSTVLLSKLKPLITSLQDITVDFYFSHHLFEPLTKGDVDMAIDCVRHEHPSLHRIPLFQEKYAVIASPELLDKYPLNHPLKLEKAPILSMDKAGIWWCNLLDSLPQPTKPVLRHIIEINYLRGIIRAACEGYGVALVPEYSVMQEISDGRLIELFPELHILEDRFYLYQLNGRLNRAVNLLFSKFITNIHIDEFCESPQNR